MQPLCSPLAGEKRMPQHGCNVHEQVPCCTWWEIHFTGRAGGGRTTKTCECILNVCENSPLGAFASRQEFHTEQRGGTRTCTPRRCRKSSEAVSNGHKLSLGSPPVLSLPRLKPYLYGETIEVWFHTVHFSFFPLVISSHAAASFATATTITTVVLLPVDVDRTRREAGQGT